MRPIKLTLEGINSFTDEQTVDFEAAGADNLFCISGCTGSGKTTVLDGMILALYPNHSERGLLSDYINLRRESGRITFTFELDGAIYTTERVISRKAGKNSFLLRRGGTPLFEGDKAFEFLKETIGLEVKEFTNVVVLQQGEFARFLRAKKGDRVALVSKLFDLSRYGELYSRFNRKAAELTADYDAGIRAVSEIAATDESVAAETERVAELEKAAAEAVAAAGEEKKKLDELTAARTAFESDERARASLAEITAKLEVARGREENGKIYREKLTVREAELRLRENGRDALVKELAERDAAERRRAELDKKAEKLAADEAELAALKKELDGAEAEEKRAAAETKRAAEEYLAAVTAAGGGADTAQAELAGLMADCRHALDECRRGKAEAGQAADRAAAAEKAYESEMNRWKVFGGAHAELEERRHKAGEAAERAAREYERAQEENALALVTAGLKVGDLCPVCGNEIADLSEHAGAGGADLNRLKAERDARERELEELRKKESASAAELAEAQARTDAAGKAAQEAAKAKEECEKKLIGADEAGLTARSAALARAEQALNAKSECEKAAREAEANRQKLSAVYLSRDRTVRSMREELEAERKAAAVPRGKSRAELEAELEALKKDREELDRDRKTADEIMTELAATATTLAGKAEATRASIKGAAAVTKEECEKAAESEKAAREKYTACVKDLAAASMHLTREKSDLGAKKARLGELDELDKKRKVYELFAKLFSKNAFTEFVAAEYISEFTAAASEKLYALTGGKYTLEYDEASGDFFVLDFLAGNIRRSVKTLSGGETFLASLSLAIAISGELSKSRSYGFFFIDEGFGTLSPDALDTVTAALTALSRETMVGMITHRSELIERIPSVIKVLPADGVRGSIVRQ